MNSKKDTLNEKFKKLSQIAEWFESDNEVDVEKGLEKVKEAVSIIKESKKRLKEIENEFQEIKKEVSDDSEENFRE
jgi:GTP1/Obg family GTP-binding protein